MDHHNQAGPLGVHPDRERPDTACEGAKPCGEFRGFRPAPLGGLLQPDGSVVVPPAVTGELLRLVVWAITERARSTGGLPTASARQLLQALYDAAERYRRADRAEEELTEAVTSGVSVAEAAEHLGCSPQWVRALLASGKLSGRRSGGVWIVYLDRPLAESQAPQQIA